MARTRVKLNYAGFDKLRHDPALAAGLEEIAQDVAARAGEGYGYDVTSMESRVIASVFTETTDAKREAMASGGVELQRALQEKKGS